MSGERVQGGSARPCRRRIGGYPYTLPHPTHGILAHGAIGSRGTWEPERPKWIRSERTYSNSMWHTDYKRLPDGRWLICCMDDASRFITGYGVFEHATAQNAILVLERAIKQHGRPASVMTDHGPQFYASASKARGGGASEFEKRLVEMGIRHVLAGSGHSQTSAKLKRFYGELQRKLHFFEEASVDRTTRGTHHTGAHVGSPLNTEPKKDAVTRFVEWYNRVRPHMSLNHGTPAMAFRDKMPPEGGKAAGEEIGGEPSGSHS